MTSSMFLGIIFISLIFTFVDVRAEGSLRDPIEAKVVTCPELPRVAWWKTTRSKIVRYVDRKYKGNWIPYIRKWNNYKRKMQNAFDNNRTVVVRSQNIVLYGEKLAAHIVEIKQRLNVIQCLKEIFSGVLASVSSDLIDRHQSFSFSYEQNRMFYRLAFRNL